MYCHRAIKMGWEAPRELVTLDASVIRKGGGKYE